MSINFKQCMSAVSLVLEISLQYVSLSLIPVDHL